MTLTCDCICRSRSRCRSSSGRKSTATRCRPCAWRVWVRRSQPANHLNAQNKSIDTQNEHTNTHTMKSFRMRFLPVLDDTHTHPHMPHNYIIPYTSSSSYNHITRIITYMFVPNHSDDALSPITQHPLCRKSHVIQFTGTYSHSNQITRTHPQTTSTIPHR